METSPSDLLRANPFPNAGCRAPGLLTVALVVLLVGGCAREKSVRKTEPPNLLLITLDTVRADHIGVYGSATKTPAIDRLAREGVRFDQAISVAPLTLPSHATILSGVLPARHGVHLNGTDVFPSDQDTLATRLQARGYRTGAFVGAFVLDRQFGLARGFDQYDDEISRSSSSDIRLEAERPASVVAERAIKWLSAGGRQPFFAWVHFYDAHAPYEPPAPWRERSPSAYSGEIAYVDAQIARIVGELERTGKLENTIVAVVGDHGEALGEHGEFTHGLLLYESTLRVPLIIRASQLITAGGVVHSDVGLVDLAPTLVGLLEVEEVKVPPAAEAWSGRDHSRALREKSTIVQSKVFAETRYPESFGWSRLSSARARGLKLILSSDLELYDLSRDRKETVDVSRRDRRTALELRRDLEALNEADLKRPDGLLTEEARRKLESLGYVAPTSEIQKDGAVNPSKKVELFQKFEGAKRDLANGIHGAAIAALGELVALEPLNPIFRGSLARALRQAGKLGQALPLYRQTVTRTPHDAEAWYNLGVALTENGNDSEALKVLTQTVAIEPRRSEFWNALGVAQIRGSHLVKALGSFDLAVGRDPRNTRALNNKGNVLRSLQRHEEAILSYERALQISPDDPESMNGLGAVLVEQDKPMQALSWFDRAVAIRPDDGSTRLNRGIALQLLGRGAEAAVEYRQALKSGGETGKAAKGLLRQMKSGS